MNLLFKLIEIQSESGLELRRLVRLEAYLLSHHAGDSKVFNPDACCRPSCCGMYHSKNGRNGRGRPGSPTCGAPNTLVSAKCLPQGVKAVGIVLV